MYFENWAAGNCRFVNSIALIPATVAASGSSTMSFQPRLESSTKKHSKDLSAQARYLLIYMETYTLED